MYPVRTYQAWQVSAQLQHPSARLARGIITADGVRIDAFSQLCRVTHGGRAVICSADGHSGWSPAGGCFFSRHNVYKVTLLAHLQTQKRLYLRVAIKAMLGVACVATVYLFGAAFFSPDRREPSPDAMRVGVSQLQPGGTLKVNWEGRPILIHHRSAAEIAWLGKAQPGLADAASNRSTQPTWARNSYRSRSPQWFVALAVREDTPCVLEFDDSLAHGGYVSRCDGVRFDSAGRVFAGQNGPSVNNMRVPVYAVEDQLIVLGGRQAQ